MDATRTPMNGRRAQAARNDARILDAAREVFLADPTAPIAGVAARAGVGISALYNRYPSKTALLQELTRDALTGFAADLESALADTDDAWDAYAACLHRVLDNGSQALAQRLAGTFTPTPELIALAVHTGELYDEVHHRTRQAGALRKDISAADVILLLEALTTIELADPSGVAALRHRYLSLILQALHTSAANTLPGPPATNQQLAARWTAR